MTELFSRLASGDSLPIAACLDSLGPLSAPMVSARCQHLAGRSLKGDSQRAGLDLAISCIDLTTLEGADTPGRVQRLVARALVPDPDDLSCPRPAAVCVYPSLVGVARTGLDAVDGHGILIASVAGAFPSGLSPLAVRLADIKKSVDAGADEIDIVLDRSLFLAGDYQTVFDDIRAARRAAQPARLKVILETGELGSLENVWRAAWLAAAAGADFLKTSTGKSGVGATPETVWVLSAVAARFNALTGSTVGVKIAGGVRSAKAALRLMLVVAEHLGANGLNSHHFRLGASTLLDDLCAQRRFHATGRYWGSEYFPLG